MIEIDGSQRSGSGTILRTSVALAAILQKPLHIYNIRRNRSKPGLRPQHLEAVLTAAEICNAKVEGTTLNSHEILFWPNSVRGGIFKANIGTAGSISMLLMTVLPICIFAKKNVHLDILNGGTDVRYSPTINYMRKVFLPVLNKMRVKAEINVHKYGYYPKGLGKVTAKIYPCESLKPICLEHFGKIKKIDGVSICTFLDNKKVAERQQKAAQKYLKERGYRSDIKIRNDRSNPLQKGSSIVLWAETDTGAILGSDAIGEPQKKSENVGREAAKKLLSEINSKATVDIHLADMLILYIALAKGKSTYLTKILSDHVKTNIWLIQKIMGIKINSERKGQIYRITKN